MSGVETRKSFHQHLDEIRDEIVALAAELIDEIPRATTILLDSDLEGAEYLIRSDDSVDARSIQIEERCYQMLALQQPMAGDLRRLIAAVKIVSEVERSADLLVNICKAARRLHGHPLDAKLRGIIARMGEQAAHLYQTALNAFVDEDAAQAAAIDDMDNLLDELQREFIAAIFESHAHGKTDLQVGVQLAMVCRFYERIGDHAVNVGERVRYMVTGWLPEHAGAARHWNRAQVDGLEPAQPQGSDPTGGASRSGVAGDPDGAGEAGRP